MATVLYLVRHGQTEGSEAMRYKGSLDVPLSREGEEQMKKAAGFIGAALRKSNKALCAVYASDLQRAVRSAKIVAGATACVVLPALRERSFGIWEGMSFNEIREQYHEEFWNWAKDPLRYSPPGGESTVHVRDRAIKALDEILRRHAGEAVAVVAHGGVNRVILCHLMGVPLENIFRIEQDFGAVNIIEFHEEYPVVKLINQRPWE